jgi:glutaredoxin 3
MTVELIYDRDCPNVLAARANLIKAIAASSRESGWTEWDSRAADSPPHIMSYGSPTVLVDGKDVAENSASGAGASCRLYQRGGVRFDGAPSIEQIVTALASQGGAAIGVRDGWKSSLLAGKFAFDSNTTTYCGLAVLVAASVWNAWPRRRREVGCRTCVPGSSSNNFFDSLKGDFIMTAKRKIEVFSAGCPACAETIELVNRIACPSCEIGVLDMNQAAVAQRAKELGIRSVPAVVIDDKLADCCAGRGPQEAALRAAGLGQLA